MSRKPIIRYERAALSRQSYDRLPVVTYKNDGESLQPVGFVTDIKWDDDGNIIRFENQEAIYVQVKS